MKNKLIMPVVILVAIIAVIGGLMLFQTAKQNSTLNKKVKIGVMAPLTGDVAYLGTSFKEGMILAQQEMGEKGKNIELVFEDNQYDPKTAITAYNKLVGVDKVDLLVDWGSATPAAIAPLVKDSKVPFLPVTYDTSVTSVDGDIVRGQEAPKALSAKILENMRTKGVKKIGILKTQSLFFTRLTEGLEINKKSDEEIIIIDNFKFGDKDFRTAILKAKNAKVDALGIFMFSGQISEYYKQANELGYKVPTFGSDFFEDQNEIDNAKGLMEGAVFPNFDVKDSFKQKVLALYGTKFDQTYTGAGYDMFNIFATKIDFTNRDTIVKSMKSLKDFHGELGEYKYVEDGNDRYWSEPVYIKEIVNNKVVTLK